MHHYVSWPNSLDINTTVFFSFFLFESLYYWLFNIEHCPLFQHIFKKEYNSERLILFWHNWFYFLIYSFITFVTTDGLMEMTSFWFLLRKFGNVQILRLIDIYKWCLCKIHLNVMMVFEFLIFNWIEFHSFAPNTGQFFILRLFFDDLCEIHEWQRLLSPTLSTKQEEQNYIYWHWTKAIGEVKMSIEIGGD